MANFVKIDDEKSKCSFINLDLVTKVDVGSMKKGGAVKVSSIAASNLDKGNNPELSPVITTYIIKLATVHGEGRISFSDSESATNWAKENLNISVDFNQLFEEE